MEKTKKKNKKNIGWLIGLGIMIFNLLTNVSKFMSWKVISDNLSFGTL